jgi:hypothetical protein
MAEGRSENGEPWRQEDGELVRREIGQRGWKLLRGGSWFIVPRNACAANRNSSHPANVNNYYGVRPCCPLPPGSLLGTNAARKPGGESPWALCPGAVGFALAILTLRFCRPHACSVRMPP